MAAAVPDNDDFRFGPLTAPALFIIRRVALGLLSTALCLGAIGAAARGRAPAVAVEYREATDLFILLDNLPDWLPGYTAAVYRQDWARRFGLTAGDERLLAAYRAFRLRHSPLARPAPERAATAVLAAPALREVEPFTRSFLAGQSFRRGMEEAVAAQAPADRAMLRAYFARFAPRARAIVASNARFRRQQAALGAALAGPRVDAFIREMEAFYGGPPSPAFVARFVWWPDRAMTQAKVRGRYILLQSDPAPGREETDWAPIVLHEFAHHLSTAMPDPDRRRLAAAFLRLCPAAARLPNPLNALEEPLAIYWGQYRFAQRGRGQALAPSESWYAQPLADRIAKALARAFPATAPAPPLGDRLIAVAGAECAAAMAAA